MRKQWMLACLLFITTAAAAQGVDDSVHQLSTAIVTAHKARIVFRSARYEVVDYAFDGDDLLILADKGGFRPRPVLLRLNAGGDTIAYGNLHFYPQKILKNCAGVPYVLGTDSLYRIRRDGRQLICEHGLPPAMADIMAACQLKLNDNFYYKGGDPRTCRVSFARRTAGDTTLRRFTSLEDSIAAEIVKYDMGKLRALVLSKTFAAEELGIYFKSWDELTDICYEFAVRKGFNGRNYGRVLFTSNLYQYSDSSIVITDYLAKKLRYFSDTGAVIGVVPMQKRWSDADNYGFLRDEVTGRFYIHFEKNSHTQYLQELQPAQGLTTGPLLTFERQFPEHVSVHDGKIYFLQHDPAGGSVRQLYVQRW